MDKKRPGSAHQLFIGDYYLEGMQCSVEERADVNPFCKKYIAKRIKTEVNQPQQQIWISFR